MYVSDHLGFDDDDDDDTRRTFWVSDDKLNKRVIILIYNALLAYTVFDNYVDCLFLTPPLLNWLRI